MQNQPPRAHLVAANASNEHRRLQYKQMRVEKTKEMAKTTKQLEMEAQILEEQAGLVRRLAEVEQKKAEMRSLSVQKPKASFSIRDSAGRKLSKPRLDAPTEDSNPAPWLVKKGCRGYEEAIRKKLQAQRQLEEERTKVVPPNAHQDPSKAKELDCFLNQIGMQQCSEPVKRAGVTSVDQLKQYDLKKLNLLPGYEIKLAKRLAEFKAGLEMQGKLIPTKSTTASNNPNQQPYLPPKPKPPSATSSGAQPLAGMQVVSAQSKGSRAISNQPGNSTGNGIKWQQARPNGFTGPALVKPKQAAPNSAKLASSPLESAGIGLFAAPRELSNDDDHRHADEGCSECSQHYRMQTTGGFRSNKHMTVVANGSSKHSSSRAAEEKVDLPLERSAATGLASNRSNKFSSIVEKHRSIHSDSTVSEVRKEQHSGDRQGERSWRETSFKTDSQEASVSQEHPNTDAKRPAPQTSSSGTDAPKPQVPVCCWRCLAIRDSKQQMLKSPLFAEPQRLFCSQQCLDLETKEKFARCTCGRPAEKGQALCHNGVWYCQPECMPKEEGENIHEDDQEFGDSDFEAFQEDPPEITDNAEYYQQLDEQVDLDFEELI